MQYRPLKNYTTTIPVNRNITEAQDTLVKYIFTGMLYKYEHGAAYQGIAVARMEEEPRCRLFSFGICARIPIPLQAAAIFSFCDGREGANAA